jgi:multidrug efflux pump subunit AcrA (membrane-fusion protein)
MEQTNYPIQLKAFDHIYRGHYRSKVKYWFWGIMFTLVIFMFLPWTQNIKSRGTITTLAQNHRPQEINSTIPGKIVQWYVKEGDFVKKGDTILKLSEIKEDYLDPNLINRTRQQADAKSGSIEYYKQKAATAELQIQALNAAKKLKLEQLANKIKQYNNKITGEKAELQAAENDLKLTKDQFDRQQKMFDQGLVSQTQLQQRNTAYQNALAKKITVENKLAQTQQDLINIKIELNSVEQEYLEKISKAEGDRFQSLSMIKTGEGDVAKLENQVSNYTIRNGMYTVLASQDGQVVQAKKAGIGEIVKEGERIAMIVPTRVDYAVEMFVRPVDLPLINLGQTVRFMFDGFPAIVFSGWPEGSYGTFSGRVVAIESTINPNGMFRVLVAEDPNERKWPLQLKLGSGAQGIALLKDVRVWYELWRNINGFPPDFYQPQMDDKKGATAKKDSK